MREVVERALQFHDRKKAIVLPLPSRKATAPDLQGVLAYWRHDIYQSMLWDHTRFSCIQRS